MIGGIEVRIRTRSGGNSVEAAVRAVRLRWPHAVYENGITAERYASFSEIPFGQVEELFVYRDQRAADLWDAEGATAAAANTMLHLLADEGQLTVVVDECDAAMNRVLAAIESALNDDIHGVPCRTAA